jgi:hypothetical protein
MSSEDAKPVNLSAIFEKIPVSQSSMNHNLQILVHLILIFAVFEPSKINYARGLILMIGFLLQFNLG